MVDLRAARIKISLSRPRPTSSIKSRSIVLRAHTMSQDLVIAQWWLRCLTSLWILASSNTRNSLSSLYNAWNRLISPLSAVREESCDSSTMTSRRCSMKKPRVASAIKALLNGTCPSTEKSVSRNWLPSDEFRMMTLKMDLRRQPVPFYGLGCLKSFSRKSPLNSTHHS